LLRLAGSPSHWVLFLAILLGGYVACWIGFNLVCDHPLEFRENAVLFTADLQNRGDNPYALEHRPTFVNVYGIAYYWLTCPFTRVFGCSYPVLRAVSCGCLVATCALLLGALRRDGVSRIGAATGALVLFAQLGQGLSIVARPDAFGLFLFLASLVVPWRFRFSAASLAGGALLAILAFLTKPYFVLSLALLGLYLFLFEGKLKALVFGGLAGLALAAVIAATDAAYECYFTETFFAPKAAATRSWAHLRTVGGSFLWQNFGFVLVLLTRLAGAFRGRDGAGDGVSRAVSPGPAFAAALKAPLLAQRGDLPWLAIICCAAAIVFSLGLNEGNDVLYYHQLISPFLLWIAVRTADTQPGRFRPGSLALAANLVLLVAQAPSFPRDASAEWRALGALVAPASDVFTAPHLSHLAQRSGKTVYDSGQTEYAFAPEGWNPSRVAGAYRERNRAFIEQILTKIRARRFDRVIINPGLCPFLPLREFQQYYVPTGTVGAPVTFDSYTRRYPLVVFVPRQPSPDGAPTRPAPR
jgi:hypothetical protein